MNAQRGAILILILMFSVLFSLLALFAMEMANMQIKMTQAFSDGFKEKFEQENNITLLEQGLYREPELFFKEKRAAFLQFVPDTLHFAEKAGLHFFELRVPGISTTQAIRFDVKRKLKRDWIKLASGAYVMVLPSTIAPTAILIQEQAGVVHRVLFPGGTPMLTNRTPIVAVDTTSRDLADSLYVGDSAGQIWVMNLDSPFYNEWQPKPWAKVNGVIKHMLVGQSVMGDSVEILVHSRTRQKDMLSAVGKDAVIWEQQGFRFKDMILKQDWVELIGAKDAETIVLDRFTGEIKSYADIQSVEGRRSWREID